jgi:hypothetical protein
MRKKKAGEEKPEKTGERKGRGAAPCAKQSFGGSLAWAKRGID